MVVKKLFLDMIRMFRNIFEILFGVNWNLKIGVFYKSKIILVYNLFCNVVMV